MAGIVFFVFVFIIIGNINTMNEANNKVKSQNKENSETYRKISKEIDELNEFFDRIPKNVYNGFCYNFATRFHFMTPQDYIKRIRHNLVATLESGSVNTNTPLKSNGDYMRFDDSLKQYKHFLSSTLHIANVILDDSNIKQTLRTKTKTEFNKVKNILSQGYLDDKFSLNGTYYIKLEKPTSKVTSAIVYEYINHCFSCKKTITSTLNKRCPKCGWYICSCGACGCGYYN
jgi:hypothetical protein